MLPKLLCVCMTLVVTTLADGNLTLPIALGSNMVLQRAPAQAKLWGWATPGAKIEATLDGTAAVSATADAQGHWSLKLGAQDAQVGRSIKIAGAGAVVTLESVAFGDVFLCAGQSHMTFSVNQDMNGSTTIAESRNYTGIRMITIDTDTATTPLANAKRVKYKGNSTWLVSAPESFGTATFSYPSAICYYYARELYTHFESKVPIGIISASVGGSNIQFWMSDASRADGLVKTGTCGGSKAQLTTGCMSPPAEKISTSEDSETALDNETAEGAVAKVRGWTPGCFYNAMIHPFGSMTLRGVLWDQGEANDADTPGCLVYGCKLAALAHDWRTNLFQQPDLLFTYDQLRADDHPMGIGVPSYPKAIPHSTYSTRVDLQTCEAAHTSEGHAVRKLEVGRRLAMAARVAEYAETATPLSFGPTIVGVKVTSASTQSASAAAPLLLHVSITLDNAMGLHFSDAPECPGCCAGKAGPLIQGNPAHGDAFTVGFTDGSHAVVCKDPAVSAACTGGAQIVDGTSAGSKSVELLMVSSALIQQQVAPAVKFVKYGGTGPWVSSGGVHERMLAPATSPSSSDYATLTAASLQQGCLLMNDTDINPHTPGLGNVAASSALECCTLCASTAWAAKGCAYFTYSKANCWFKSNADTKVPSQGKTSGHIGAGLPTPPPTPPTPPTPPLPTPPPKCVYPHQPRFGIEACALYNGAGGYDSHAGIAMPAQLYQVDPA
jgi:sialate O-acetylesterase